HGDRLDDGRLAGEQRHVEAGRHRHLAGGLGRRDRTVLCGEGRKGEAQEGERQQGLHRGNSKGQGWNGLRWGRHSRGVRVILLKRTSAPSDWIWSFPRVTPRSVARLTVTPFSSTVIVSPFMVTTSVFHSPTPFSTSFLPRNPSTFSQDGSRPDHRSRLPGPKARAGAPSFQYRPAFL